MNLEIYNTVLTHIEQHPEQWNQACPLEDRPACCFLGNARRLFDRLDRVETTGEAGAEVLEIPPNNELAHWLYSADRTLDDFRRVRLVAGYANFPAAA